MIIFDIPVVTGVGALAIWAEPRGRDDSGIALRVEVGFSLAYGDRFLVPLSGPSGVFGYILYKSLGIITGRWIFEAREVVAEPVPEALQGLRRLRLGVPYQGARTDFVTPQKSPSAEGVAP